MNRDLTAGKPASVLWRFCLPLLGSIVFQQLYNLADSWVAGKFIGQNALASVGNAYEITLIFLAFSVGCNIGCSVVVSQLFGAGKYRDVKTAVCTAMLASGAVCILLMMLGLLGGSALLRLIHTPEELFADSALYLKIYVWGLPFVLLYNVSTGIFSALGDSRTPFLFLVASSVANIAMDILFVRVFSMGVGGVAWATFLCQGISCLLALTAVLYRLRGISPSEKAPLFSLLLLRRFVWIAVPSILQQSFISVGNIVIQGVINGFGAEVVAGYSASVKLNNLVITSFTTLGNGMSNYTAQNIGAGKTVRVREGFRAGLLMVWALCIPVAALYFFAPRALMGFFLKEPTECALMSGATFLKILSPFYCVVAAKLAVDGILRGAGQMRQFMTATFTDLVIRVVLASALSVTVLGANGIWCAWPIGWCIGTVLSLIFYRRSFAKAEKAL